MRQIPKPYEVYRHFKGNLYQIVTIAEHSETGEALVVYQALYGDFQRYARPLSMFMEKTDREKYPFATQEYRFELTELGQRETVEARNGKPSGIPSRPGENAAAEHAGNSEKADTMDADNAGTEAESIQEEAEKLNIDPMVLEFLDARSYEERLKILSQLRPRITDSMINVMSIAADVEIKDGDIEERFDELRTCLSTRQRYESRSSRLR